MTTSARRPAFRMPKPEVRATILAKVATERAAAQAAALVLTPHTPERVSALRRWDNLRRYERWLKDGDRNTWRAAVERYGKEA